MLLSVIIPSYNEGNTLKGICDRVLNSDINPIKKEIWIIDDASTDNTQEVIDELCHAHNNIFSIKHKVNQGKGAALRKGFQSANGELIIVQDADLEYNPDEYPTMLEPIISGNADVVYGSRFLTSKSHRVLYFWHSIGNNFLTLFSNMLTDLNLTDMETCYKIFKREVLENINIKENRFGFEPEITAKISRIRPRINIYEVGISYSGRTYEEGKKINWVDGLRAIWCIFKYRFLD